MPSAQKARYREQTAQHVYHLVIELTIARGRDSGQRGTLAGRLLKGLGRAGRDGSQGREGRKESKGLHCVSMGGERCVVKCGTSSMARISCGVLLYGKSGIPRE